MRYLSQENFPIKTSFPSAGFDGILRAKIRETMDIAEPAKKTIDGEYNQTSPKTTGIKTAAIWLIVKETPELDAISAGSAIFWK